MNTDTLTTTETRSCDIQSCRALVAACSNGVAGVLIFSTLPLILGGFAERYDLDDVQTGLLGSVYFGLYSLIALSSAVWILRLPWRPLSGWGIGLMLLGLLICRAWSSFPGAVTGLSIVALGAALIYPVSFTIISYRSEKDRDYAIKLIPEQLVPGLLLVITATLFSDQLSIFPFLGLLSGLLVLSLLFSRWVPNRPRCTTHASLLSGNPGIVLLALLALNLSFMGFAGLWAFLERIGQQNQLSSELIGQLIALGLLGSALGPLCAALLADRLGRLTPLLGALLGSTLPLGLGLGGFDSLGFGVMMGVLPFAYYFGISYFFGIVADADGSGRFSALMPFSLALGAAMGPYLFGLFKSSTGIEGAFTFVTLSLVSGTLLILAIARHKKPLDENPNANHFLKE